MKIKHIIKDLEQCIKYFSEFPQNDLIKVIGKDKYIRLSFILSFLERHKKDAN